MEFTSCRHILVVDDEHTIVDLLEEFFKGLGCNVSTAASAEEALEKLRNGKSYQLVLTDINMPGKSGLDLLKIIRETREDLPVVLLTGLKTLDNAINAVKSGATDYITKPFELSTLQRVVERILRKQDRIVRKEQIYENLNYLKLNFEYETGKLDPGAVARKLVKYLEKIRFAESDELGKYELAFTETLVNAIEHGNLELASRTKNSDSFQIAEYEELKEKRLNEQVFAERKIIITFECTREVFNFSVKDEGNGFNWRKYLNSSHQIQNESMKSYGRGFHLIRHVIDEVHFNDTGNIITLIKNSAQNT
ncbi:MAG: response regulator [Calditrichaeota bacterium]|nr:response regulator [Calditrichota bacterium]RQW08138.1 MAG: response regulator [Calditrichota bacterium]